MNYTNLFESTFSNGDCNKINRFLEPLYNYLGVNHFWWYKITSEGEYAYFGTHLKWSEFCFENNLHLAFPCLHYPTVQTGVQFMKASNEKLYLEILETVWEKFQINFSINLVKKNNNSVEAFGFGVHYNDVKADERMINEIALLNVFCEAFKKKFSGIFELAKKKQVRIAPSRESIAYESPRTPMMEEYRAEIVKMLGDGNFPKFTPKEKEVLKYLRNGYSANFIASKLYLSSRTVENYTVTLKERLFCDSKNDLIEKCILLDDLSLL